MVTRIDQRVHAILVGRRRHLAQDEFDRGFLQSADRLALGVAVDAAVRRIRRVARDARRLEALRVDPQAVATHVGERRRSIRHDLIEQLFVGHAFGREQAVAPAHAVEPARAGFILGALGDDPLVVGRRIAVVERASRVAQAAPHGMRVRVVERRQHEPTAEVDDPGPRPDERRRVFLVAERHDAAATDGQRRSRRLRVVDGVELRVLQHQLGSGRVGGLRPSCPQAATAQNASARIDICRSFRTGYLLTTSAVASSLRTSSSPCRRSLAAGRVRRWPNRTS